MNIVWRVITAITQTNTLQSIAGVLLLETGLKYILFTQNKTVLFILFFLQVLYSYQLFIFTYNNFLITK